MHMNYWQIDYNCVLRKMFERGWVLGKLKNKIKVRNEKDWEEKVYTKCTLKWYRLAKDGAGVE